ncbi:MAG TPA: hypothetical protein VF790_12400 [Dissulfurispiraceae bacterium]
METDEKDKIEAADETGERVSCSGRPENKNQEECDDDFLSVFVSM